MSLNPNASISNVFFDVCVVAIFISAVHLLSAFRLIQRTIQKFNWSRRKLTCEWNAWPMTLDTLKNAWSSVYLQTARLLFCCRWGCCQWFCHNLFVKSKLFSRNWFQFSWNFDHFSENLKIFNWSIIFFLRIQLFSSRNFIVVTRPSHKTFSNFQITKKPLKTRNLTTFSQNSLIRDFLYINLH